MNTYTLTIEQNYTGKFVKHEIKSSDYDSAQAYGDIIAERMPSEKIQYSDLGERTAGWFCCVE